ncbi:acid protease [Aspergillus sclerotioniger CBS 115572]|uniref:Acid protease n=1 Tax=Aspergillus sclerotioniger CBS 115572 TaxID=1450535 RepID=A0A317WWC4_9EURO|nr:acid protease [Aspergillus sclerotioniger CBS 115572]PWY90355.1 acid protease [Aspergillus sclerotioniger CBS 115572]
MKYLPFWLAGFTLQLIEARPFRSPQTIKLRSHGGQRVRSSHPGRENVSLRDWIVNTDLQWYSTIQVGTPPQTLTVMYDTGSTELVLPGKNCINCGSHTLFESNKSKSFSHTPNMNLVGEFSTGATTVPLSTSELVNCTINSDTVTLGGLTASNQWIILCTQFPSIFKDLPMDGIMGLGVAPQPTTDECTPTFWSWYYSGQLAEPIFSFYFVPGATHHAELTLGGVDPSKYIGPIAYANLNQNVSILSSAYVLDFLGLYINDRPVFTTSNYTSGIPGGQPAPFASGLLALDTGTAFLQTPDKQTAEEIYRQISPYITQIDPAGAWGAPCPILDAIATDITFRIGGGGPPITLPREFFNLGEYPGQPGICQAVFNNPTDPMEDPTGQGRAVWLVGSPLLKAYYTVWNGLDLQVGFAQPLPPWL